MRKALRKPRQSRLGGSGNAQSGLTYLVMLFIVVMMGIALSSAATIWHTAAKRDKERELLFIGEQFRNALLSYAGKKSATDVMQGGAQYPTSLDQLLRDDRVPTIRRHLRKIFVDPLTGKAEWGLIRRDGKIIGIYSLAQGKPLMQANFPETFRQFADARSYAQWRFSAEPTVELSTEKLAKVDADPTPPATPEETPKAEDPPPLVSSDADCIQAQERHADGCSSRIFSDEANQDCENAALKVFWACMRGKAASGS